jgi:hypothetical protein
MIRSGHVMAMIGIRRSPITIGHRNKTSDHIHYYIHVYLLFPDCFKPNKERKKERKGNMKIKDLI